jgi:uncharacterized pyridoxamine 5'-phosphate oxidase family protein
MRDARTKINNGKDLKLNFLKINFSEITCNFRSSIYRCFPKVKPSLRNFWKSLVEEKKIYFKTLDQKLKMKQIHKKIS